MNEHNKNPDEEAWQEQIQDLEREGSSGRGFVAKHVSMEKPKSNVTSVKVNLHKDKSTLKAVSIKIPQSLLEDLKVLAAQDNIGYQTFIKQILSRYVREEKHKRKQT